MAETYTFPFRYICNAHLIVYLCQFSQYKHIRLAMKRSKILQNKTFLPLPQSLNLPYLLELISRKAYRALHRPRSQGLSVLQSKMVGTRVLVCYFFRSRRLDLMFCQAKVQIIT